MRTIERWLGILALDRTARYSVSLGRVLAYAAIYLGAPSVAFGLDMLGWEGRWRYLEPAFYLGVFVAVPLALTALLVLGCAKFVYGRGVEVRIPALLAGLVVGVYAFMVFLPILVTS